MNLDNRLEQFKPDRKGRDLIIHVDDMGMSQSGLSAFDVLWKAGAVTSGSVMTPCAWFPAAADWHQKNPDADLGLHLTLTSEWDNLRWGPSNTSSEARSLLDESHRYFHKTREAFCEHATPTAVADEIQRQLDFAAHTGMRVSHLDCHMYTCMEEKFLPCFLQLAVTHKLPALVTWEHLNRLEPAVARQWAEKLHTAGLPVFDRVIVINKSQTVQDYIRKFRAAISNLPQGLSCLLVHPATDSEELRSFSIFAQHQVNEFLGLLQISSLQVLANLGVNMIDYRSLMQGDDYDDSHPRNLM